MCSKLIKYIFNLFPLLIVTHCNVIKPDDGCIDNLCSTANNYPIDIINNLTDPLIFGNTTYSNGHNSIHFELSKSCKFCNTKISKKFRPVVMKDTFTGAARFVVNTDKYNQEIDMEVCDYSRPSKCENIRLFNYYGECEQKRSTLKLLLLSQDKSKLETADVTISTGCVCTKYLRV